MRSRNTPILRSTQRNLLRALAEGKLLILDPQSEDRKMPYALFDEHNHFIRAAHAETVAKLEDLGYIAWDHLTRTMKLTLAGAERAGRMQPRE